LTWRTLLNPLAKYSPSHTDQLRIDMQIYSTPTKGCSTFQQPKEGELHDAKDLEEKGPGLGRNFSKPTPFALATSSQTRLTGAGIMIL
jgi:hypothetical protein